MTVEELLNKKKIPYQEANRDFLIQCLNPLHSDDNPSMRVDRVLGIYHCLSCGEKGNLFFKFGENSNKLTIKAERVRRKIEDIRAESIGLQMPNDAVPLTAPYRVGLEVLDKFGAFRSAKTDFIGRIWFPIKDVRGRIAAFHGRAENPFEKPKYKTYPGGSKLPLYPLEQFKAIQGSAIVVEGIFDMLNLQQHGLTNVVCAFGTTGMSAPKMQLLKLLGVTCIDVCFDPDEAGQKGAEEVKELADSMYIKTRIINLKGDDPGDLSKSAVLKLQQQLYGD